MAFALSTPRRSAAAGQSFGTRSGSPELSARWRWALLAVLAAAALFQLLTIRAGHTWGDDFALYILHAKALFEGRPYGDTGFIYYGAYPFFSPAAYPPGFPLLLLPVYALFGLDLFAMKVLVCAFMIGALVLYALLLRPLLPAPYLLPVVALLGFQPHWTDFKQQVLPDFPFVFFVLLNLLLLGRLLDRTPRGWPAFWWGVLAGVTLFFAFALRSVGIALYAAFALMLLVRRMLPLHLLAGLVLTSAALWLWQRSLMPGATGYGAQLAQAAGEGRVFDPAPYFRHAWVLVNETRYLWFGLPARFAAAIQLVLLPLALLGLLLRLRRPTLLEAFTLAYCGILFVYPAQLNMRYLIPVVPGLFYYAATGTLTLVRRFGRPAAIPAAAFALLLAAVCVVQLARADYGRIRTGALGTDAIDLWGAVQACTQPGDRVMFYKPRALALFTGRDALLTPRDGIAGLGAMMLETGSRYAAFRREDPERAAAEAGGLDPIFANNTFVLYRNDAVPPSPTAAPPRCTPLASSA